MDEKVKKVACPPPPNWPPFTATAFKVNARHSFFLQARWFSDGEAIGSKSFGEGIFTRCREHFGPKRKTGARPVREDAGGLHALRELRRRAAT